MSEIIKAIAPEHPTWHHVAIAAMVCSLLMYQARVGLLRAQLLVEHHVAHRAAVRAATTPEQLAALADAGRLRGPGLGFGQVVLLVLGLGLLSGGSEALLTWARPSQQRCDKDADCPKGQTCVAKTCSSSARKPLPAQDDGEQAWLRGMDFEPDNRAPGLPVYSVQQ